MEKWEYYAPVASWSKETEQWTMDGKSAKSIGALLSAFGEEGWELVSATAEYWWPTYLLGSLAAGGEVYWYRAFFKRRKS